MCFVFLRLIRGIIIFNILLNIFLYFILFWWDVIINVGVFGKFDLYVFIMFLMLLILILRFKFFIYELIKLIDFLCFWVKISFVRLFVVEFIFFNVCR